MAHFSTSMRLLVRAAKKLGVKVTPIAVPYNLARFTYRGKSVIVKGTIPAVNSMVAGRLSGSKYQTKIVLKAAGINRFPKAEFVSTPAEARRAARKLGYPLVVKPVAGAHGFGITVGVRTVSELNRAIAKAAAVNRERNYEEGFVVEQLKVGHDYRFFVIDGRVWAVLERVPASVIGDGTHSVKQLIAQWNARPNVGDVNDMDKPLLEITVDADVHRYLREQHATLATVPARGVRIWLRKQANISLGGTSYDVTDEASPQLKRWAAKIVSELGLRVAGVDIMAKNVRARSPKAADAWLLEVNDAPGIDIHHYPYRGKPQPVAYGIVKSVVPEVKLPAGMLPRY